MYSFYHLYFRMISWKCRHFLGKLFLKIIFQVVERHRPMKDSRESKNRRKKYLSFFLFILLCISTNLCVCVQNVVINCIELKFFLAYYIFCSEQSKTLFQHSIWLHLLKIQHRWGFSSINFIALDEIHHLE